MKKITLRKMSIGNYKAMGWTIKKLRSGKNPWMLIKDEEINSASGTNLRFFKTKTQAWVVLTNYHYHLVMGTLKSIHEC
tara:strand:- start:191 stop:427 length:237 start_codon:yes stop_codon:yes gene_type:complete